MTRFLPLLAAGILGALFAGAAVYQATRGETPSHGGGAGSAAAIARPSGNCCAAQR